jgi:hypothetical protein
LSTSEHDIASGYDLAGETAPYRREIVGLRDVTMQSPEGSVLAVLACHLASGSPCSVSCDGIMAFSTACVELAQHYRDRKVYPGHTADWRVPLSRVDEVRRRLRAASMATAISQPALPALPADAVLRKCVLLCLAVKPDDVVSAGAS